MAQGMFIVGGVGGADRPSWLAVTAVSGDCLWWGRWLVAVAVSVAVAVAVAVAMGVAVAVAMGVS